MPIACSIWKDEDEQPAECQEETVDQKTSFDFMECYEEVDAEYDVGDNDDDDDDDVHDEQVYLSNEDSDAYSDEEILNDYDQTQNSVKWVRNNDNSAASAMQKI